MSDTLPQENPDATYDPARRAKHAGSGKRRRNIWIVLLLVLLITSAIDSSILWRKYRGLRHDIAATQDLLGAARGELENLTARLQDLDTRLSGEIGGRLQNLDERQHALDEATQELRSSVEGGAENWIVGEAEYLLGIANERLLLERDVRTAITALETADRRLRAVKDPSLLHIRRMLSEEIAALRNVEEPDVEGIALTLEALANSIDALPLLSLEHPEHEEAATPPAGETQGWRQVVRKIWAELKGLVVIKRKGDTGPPLLLPDERYFLRQNLHLQLETAEAALLRRNGKVFQNSVRSAHAWIKRYFDTQAGATAHALDTLARLGTTEIAPKLPAVSGSLEALQEWSKRKQTPRRPGTKSP